MELKKIIIENFRSIKEETITFPFNCMVLLGKNEAGKTNLLKAIAALFGEYKVSDKDKRKRIDNEKIDSFSVWGIFTLTVQEIKKVEEALKKKYEGAEHITFKSGISLRQYIEKRFYHVLLNLDIANGKQPYLTYYATGTKETELENSLAVAGDVVTIDPAGKFNLDKAAHDIIKALFQENPIKCHYWQYSDSYLLPNSVIIEDFIAKPSDFKALENIFALCDREDISKEFEAAMSEDGDYANLLEQISKKVTTTFQKIWKDFKGTSIQLSPNGEEILIKVVEKAKYNFEDRSDGFKKFISILLMLSTPSRANKILENDLVLIDEPDQSLYPTSAQYLRDELIQISKKSKVIYSTHSQYMIDAECLDRHIVVEKNHDVTTLQFQQPNAPFAKDELLRRAIGASIFECLQPRNIIFEGYLDRELFRTYCKFHNMEKDFKEIGTVYLGGISGAETLVQLLILANKKFIIIADTDEVSNNKRSDFEKNYADFKDRWIGYADVCKDVSTMEDFITVEHIKDQLKKNGYTYTYNAGKNAIINIDQAVNKDKELKQQFKKGLMDSVKKETIIPQYGEYLKVIKEKIELI